MIIFIHHQVVEKNGKENNNNNLTKLNYYNIHSTISPQNQHNEVLQIHYHTGDSWPQISYYVVQSIRSAMQSWTVVYYINIICPKQFNKKTIDNKVYELLSDLHNGHASKPYSNIGIHFVRTICKITSSDAHPSIFLNIALAALSEHLKDRELTMWVPRYLVTVTHGINWPEELLILTHSASYLKTLKSDTLLPPVNITSEIERHWVMGGKKKYIEMFGCFTEPFNWSRV